MENLKLSKRLSMSFEELKSAEQIFGGFGECDGNQSLEDSSSGCWCTCHCMELSITGFQLGMMANQSSGSNTSPSCGSGISQMFGL